MVLTAWTAPTAVARDDVLRTSASVLARPALDVDRRVDVFRITAVGMDWDLGVVVYEPTDREHARGADGRKIGILLLHGGSGDFKDVEPVSQLMSERFSYTVIAGTFPGRFHFPDPDSGWPGDTLREDGAVRTPVWKVGETIGRSEYDVVTDTSLRDRYGTRTLARAKPGTNFYSRMAGWPVALEEGMIAACRRHLPGGEYSIYGAGHSTGGPFICMLSQRIPNFAGVIAAEHSPFGYMCALRDDWGGPVGTLAGHKKAQQGGPRRSDPFEELSIRTWRDLARYAGPEALGREGALALMKLPALMEDVLDSWKAAAARPQFKAEYVITHDVERSLARAAAVTAERLGLDSRDRDALVRRYLGYTRPLTGPGTKPLVPFLFAIAKDSRDHSPEVYEEVILPAFRALEPGPRVELTRIGAGRHSFWKPEADLPLGIAPAVVQLFDDAITNGYFVP